MNLSLSRNGLWSNEGMHKLGAGEIRVEFIDEEFFQMRVKL